MVFFFFFYLSDYLFTHARGQDSITSAYYYQSLGGKLTTVACCSLSVLHYCFFYKLLYAYLVLPFYILFLEKPHDTPRDFFIFYFYFVTLNIGSLQRTP
jgi:hypothetical protein